MTVKHPTTDCDIRVSLHHLPQGEPLTTRTHTHTSASSPPLDGPVEGPDMLGCSWSKLELVEVGRGIFSSVDVLSVWLQLCSSVSVCGWTGLEVTVMLSDEI